MDTPLIPLSLSTVQNHSDSTESSPNYHIVNNQTWPDNHDPLPNVPNAKLRLMCSYAGHIMPRPHDKSLSYVGGETRIVAVDRHTSLKDLCLRLSHSLLHGRAFTLKYQLPNEELDNLITVTTDEDLGNMVEEHDRLASSRLRVFLFFNKPDTTVSMCSLMEDVKSDTLFVDALNNCGILQRGVSDSAAVDQCLVNIDEVRETNDLKTRVIVEATPITVVDSTKEVKEELHSVENNSSSMANLPPITVHGCDRIQEQFAQMSFGTKGVRHNLLDHGYAISSAATPMNAIPEAVKNIVINNNNNNNNMNLVNVCDDDRSDHNEGLVGVYRKPPLPLQLVQPRTFNAACAGFGLASPDSVASESSIASENSLSKTVYYHQEQVQPPQVDNKALPMPNIKTEISEHTPTLQREQVQVQDSCYTLPQQQLDQSQQLQHQQQQQQQHQQFVYIHHPAATGQVPTISSYYPLYPPPSQQQLHHAISQQQYPLYVMPVGPKQHVIPQGSAASAVYKDGAPPIYPTNLATPTISEVGPNVYKATMASNPAFVHIPSNQFQQQYVTLPQNIHHQTHPIAMGPSATTNYGYDQYDGTMQDQVYYTQQPPQYQSMTLAAAAAAALSDVSEQFPIDNIQYPNRDSQPV
ncbi:hypothetical protein Lal_00015968 [Lupinus albus]|uniref:Putative PB1 domain-containing protein n=1 Tax=Lupinus albus TaxID=3870 RepID=A0A6A4QI80_LUPAL|nr:putative PB1 domain-containing protein [Lupinus albus]KAF1872866.1 hypothetical protein Lal_00015968 [Lupinus albus]